MLGIFTINLLGPSWGLLQWEKNIYNIFELWDPGASWAPAGALFTFRAPAGALFSWKKIYIFFSIWAPHNEVWAPGASGAPAGALSTLKKIMRHVHDFHDRNNKRIKFVDTRGLWVWEEEEEEEEEEEVWIKAVWSRSWLYRDHLPTMILYLYLILQIQFLHDFLSCRLY